MPFFWDDIQCSTQWFKFVGAVNSSGKDCFPTAVAMLVWNLGYGFGSEWMATRTTVYAQLKDPRQKKETKNANCFIIGLWGRMVAGTRLDVDLSVLDAYGLTYDVYLNQDIDFSENRAEKRGQKKSIQQLADIINTLKDGEGAIVGGITDNGEGHAIAVIRRKHVLVALDRNEESICWAHLGNSGKLAKVSGGSLEISGYGPGAKIKQSRATSLEEVQSVYVIRQQRVVTTLAYQFGNWLTSAHRYFY